MYFSHADVKQSAFYREKVSVNVNFISTNPTRLFAALTPSIITLIVVLCSSFLVIILSLPFFFKTTVCFLGKLHERRLVPLNLSVC